MVIGITSQMDLHGLVVEEHPTERTLSPANIERASFASVVTE
jgi:hypothetical protein